MNPIDRSATKRLLQLMAFTMLTGHIAFGQQTCPAVNFYGGQTLDSYANGQVLGFLNVMGGYMGYAAATDGSNSAAMPQLSSLLKPCYVNPNRKAPPADEPSEPAATQPGQLVAIGDIDGRSDFGAVFASGFINGTDLTAYRLDVSTRQVTSNSTSINGILGDSVVLADFNGDQIPDIGALTLTQGSGTVSSSVVLQFGKGDGTFQAPVYLPVNEEVGGLTAADVNGDGKMDLILSGASGEVWLAKGDGTFQAPIMIGAPLGQSALNASTAAVGDVNNDGKVDLVFGTPTGLAVALGSGSGIFQTPMLSKPAAGASGSQYVVLGDFNHDGFLDAAATSGNTGIETWKGNGNGTFSFSAVYLDSDPPWSLILADLDGDGNIDILSATGSSLAFSGITNTGETLTVLYGNGDGTFLGLPLTEIDTGSSSRQLVSGDFNGDGKADLAVLRYSNLQTLFGGGAQFAIGPATTLSVAANGMAAGDFNGDKKLDLALATSSGVTILTGTGNGTFATGATYSVNSQPSGIVAGDLNGDGKPDLVAFSGPLGIEQVPNSAQVSVLLNQGSGSFGPPVNYPSANAIGVIIGDFNGDGKPDLAVLSGLLDTPAGAVMTPASVSILLGNGQGSFQSPVVVANTGQAISMAAGDFNNDGKADLAVISQDDGEWTLSIFLGNGSGSMTAGGVFPTEFGPGQPVIADFDGDGNNDLLIPYCCGQGLGTGIRAGKGDGTFGPETIYLSLNGFQSALTADFNGDGKPDLAASLYSGITLAINASQTRGMLTTVSAAGFSSSPVAADSIVALFGSGLATSTASAQSTPLPAILNGTSASITDAAGATASIPLFFVSPDQVNAYLPATVATGAATVTVNAGNGVVSSGIVQVANVAPGIFLLNSASLAAAQGLRIQNGTVNYFPVFALEPDGGIGPAPIDLSQGTVYLVLYTTGIRHETQLGQVTATMGGVNAPVLFSGAQSGYFGLDQVNVQIPASLAGKGDVEVLLTVGGVQSNVAHVTIK